MADDITSPANGSGSKESGNSKLSNGAPLPPDAKKPAKSSLLQQGMGQPPGGPLSQMGPQASDPFVQTMAGVKQVEQGIQMLSASNPQLSPILSQILMAVQQAAVQSAMGPTGQGPGLAPQNGQQQLAPPPPGMGGAPGAPGPGTPGPPPMMQPLPSPIPAGV